MKAHSTVFERFIFLQHLFPPGQRGGKQQYRQNAHARANVQQEMFHLVQVIASQYFPDLQAELTTCRRLVMEYLTSNEKQQGSFMRKQQERIIPKRMPRVRWADFQITPEIANDPTLTNLAVPKHLAKQLRALHARQIREVQDLLFRFESKAPKR